MGHRVIGSPLRRPGNGVLIDDSAIRDNQEQAPIQSELFPYEGLVAPHRDLVLSRLRIRLTAFRAASGEHRKRLAISSKLRRS